MLSINIIYKTKEGVFLNSSKSNHLKTLIQFLNGSKLLFIFALIASVLNTVFNSITPQIIRITIDSILNDMPFNLPKFIVEFIKSSGIDKNVKYSLAFAALCILIISLLSGISMFLCRVSIAKASENFIKKMRDTLFSHIQNLPYSWHMKHQTGDIIQRCNSDVEVIRVFISNQMLQVFHVSFLIIFGLTIMFSMNIKLSTVALIFIPVIILYSGIFYHKISNKFFAADEAEGVLSSTVQENLTGVRVVRAFGRERFEIERFDEKNNNFASLWIKLGNLMSLYWGIGDLFTGLQIMTIIILGTVETIHGNISLGEFIAFISYNSTLVWPIRELGRIISEMSKSGVSFDRINYILNTEEEKDAPDAEIYPMDRDIEFKNINFSYEGEKAVLKNINFTIKKGTTFAILGGTGSGKSTLMHLLNRIYDLPEECGSIEIGGVNINKIKRSWVRQNIGIVLQEPFLFSRTIHENISIFRPNAPVEEIRHVANISCIDESISSFKNGYDTVVGERGVTLSGGQKQRIAIARMLMQKAPIMVFDDSLSAVDSETDFKIRTSLKQNLSESTVILISHRITTLMQADTIMVLENGQIAEIGTHEQLISKNGIYRQIYDIQMNHSDIENIEIEGRDFDGCI